MWSTVLSCCCRCCCSGQFELPENYIFVEVLGEGNFGVVWRCWNTNIDCMEAVKISKSSDSQQELKMLKKCSRHNLHKHNIVRLLNSFPTSCGPALVMEDLDINLIEYLDDMEDDESMTLSDVRCIIKQMAVALDALKNIGVIHSDIKPDNIMIEDRHERPLRVKLIDFGLAIHRNETTLGTHVQHLWFSAPETILGLPITEAIDMWSLGCVTAYMITRVPILSGKDPHEIMQCIVLHCGQPEDHLLDEGLNTKRHFSRTESNRWMIKGCLNPYSFSTGYPDVLTKNLFFNKTKAQTLEAQQCMDLLMAMLTLDASERITPTEVLMHPFITGETLSSGGDEASVSAPGDCTNKERDHDSPSSTITLPRVIHVQPAKAENTQRLEDTENTDSLHIQAIKTSRPVSSTSSSDCEDPATHPKTTDIQPAHHSPSTTITLPRVIHVQPAKAENTWRLEDHDSSDSLQAGLVTTTENVSIVTEDTSTSTSEDFPTCVKKQLPPPPVTESSSKKEKKKKNCFRRFFSWMKKTFCPCRTCVDDKKE